MFSIPVKVLTISGGGGDLPLMTWDVDNAWYAAKYTAWADYFWIFSNLNTTLETVAGHYVKAKGEYSIVPDRWYLEMKLNVIAGQYGAVGVIPNSTSLTDASIYTSGCWHLHQMFNGSLDINGYTWDSSYDNPVVYASNGSTYRILSLDGINPITTLATNDIVQLAGDRSDGTFWIGLNGNWLYWATGVYNEGLEIYELEWSLLGDPENNTAPVYADLPSSINPFFISSDDGSGGAIAEKVTLFTHTDDLVYTPPTGFSVVSGDAETTYLNVLRDRNLMPISQPTDHVMMGALGL